MECLSCIIYFTRQCGIKKHRIMHSFCSYRKHGGRQRFKRIIILNVKWNVKMWMNYQKNQGEGQGELDKNLNNRRILWEMSLGLFEKSVGISQMTGQRHSCKKKKKKKRKKEKSGKKSKHRHEKSHTVYKERGTFLEDTSEAGACGD